MQGQWASWYKLVVTLASLGVTGIHLGINLRGGEVELVLPQGGHHFHTERKEMGFKYQHNNESSNKVKI